MADTIRLSETVEAVIYVLEQCKADVAHYLRQQEEAEAELTNLEHELEGVGVKYRVPPNSKQRSVLATQYQRQRIRRRCAKDAIRLCQPLTDFIKTESGTKMINQLRNVMGELRKAEKATEDRRYSKREAIRRPPAENPKAQANLNKLIRDWRRKAKS